MTSRNNTGFASFTAAAAITEGQRVKVTSSRTIDVAGATDPWIGTALTAIASGAVGTVQLRNAPGTCFVVASAAITAGAILYPTASGKVDDASGTGLGTGLVALEAATADGDIIEATPCDPFAYRSGAAQAAAVTTAATQSSPFGFATQAQADALVALANEARATFIAMGVWKGAA